MLFFILMETVYGVADPGSFGLAGYDLYYEYSEIAEDYSGNAHTLTSGSTLSTADSDDVIFTVRGAYFYSDSIMKFPPNSVSNSFVTLGESFFISTWLYFQNPGPFFQIRASEVYFELAISASSVSWTFFGDTYTVEHTNTALEWIFINLELRKEEAGSTLLFHSPTSEEFSVSEVFQDKYYEQMILGGGFQGTIYDFYLDTEYIDPFCFSEAEDSDGSCTPIMDTCNGDVYVDEFCEECSDNCTGNSYSCYSIEPDACIQCPDICMTEKNHGVCLAIGQSEDTDNCLDIESEYCLPFSYDINSSSCDWTSCTDNCEVCSSADTCAVCQPPYARSGALSCVESCPDGYFAYGEYYKECLLCPDTCPDNCFEDGRCDPCPDTFAIEVDGTCQCQDGYYQSSSGRDSACLICLENCSKCNDGSTCTECVEPRILNDSGTCDCPDGFFETSGQVCSACLDECETCTDETTCTACKDRLDFNENGVCECKTGYFQLSDNPKTCEECSYCAQCGTESCELCIEGAYLEGKNCQLCRSGCSSCINSSACTSCKDTFVLESGRCECPKSHQEEGNVCVKVLEASFSYNDKTLLLTFSENLSRSLNETDITNSYITPSNTIVQVDVASKSLAEYEIAIKSGTDIPDDADGLSVEIGSVSGESGTSLSSPVVSFPTTQAVLESVVQIEEEISGVEEAQEVIEEVGGPTAATGMTSGSILLSISMNQFSALWSFVNTAQIFALMPIQNMDAPDAVASVWRSFDEESFAIPNLGELIYEDEHSEAPKEWADNDYETTNFLINAGEFLFIAILTLMLLPLFYVGWLIFRGYKKLGKFMIKRMRDYKWCFFLRLGLEGFIDLMASALLSAGTIDDEVSVEAVLSIILLVIGFLFTGGLFAFVYILQNMIQAKDKRLTKFYGTIFDEFRNDKGYFSMLFYPLFCVRRLIYIFVLYFGSDYPLIQILTNLVCTLCIVAYLVYYRPFKESEVQEITLVSECVIAFNFGMSIFFLYDLNEEEEFTVVFLIYVSILFMLAVIYYYMILSVLEMLKKCCKKKGRVMPVDMNEDTEKIQQSNDGKQTRNVDSDPAFNIVHNISFEEF